MDWKLLEKAININGVTHLVFNKVDILREINAWAIREENLIRHFDTENDMKDWIAANLSSKVEINNVFFSDSPNYI